MVRCAVQILKEERRLHGVAWSSFNRQLTFIKIRFINEADRIRNHAREEYALVGQLSEESTYTIFTLGT